MEYELPSVEDQEAQAKSAEKRLKAIVNEHCPKDDPSNKTFRLMVRELLPIIGFCPASGTIKYHGAWAGGLLVHTVEVIEVALKLAETVGPDAFKLEDRPAFLRSVVVAAFLHDIGKIGDGTNAYYIEQDNDWRRDKLGETYTINRDLSELIYLPIPVRGLWLAQKFGVYLTPEETQSIVSSDGPQTELGKVVATFFETPLTMVVHFADKWVSMVRKV